MGTERPTDSELLAQHIAGDSRAFDALVRRWTPRLRNFIAQRLRNDPDAASDILQETWLRVHRNAARFDQLSSFSTWIHTIALNLTYNHLRDTQRRSRRVQPWPQVEQKAGASKDVEFADERPLRRADVRLEHEEFLDMVARAIQKLPAVQREVIILRYEGTTYDDIARRLGINLGTVKSRLNRGKAAVQRLVAEMQAR